MQNINFIYWLQGFFELTTTKSGLNSKQIKIIKNHIDLTLHTENNPVRFDFINWLAVYLDICTKRNNKNFISPKDVAIIKEELNGLFEHIIDPMTYGDDKITSQIHSPNSEILVRC